ncbi:MAG: 4-alpha-glucanotransferase [Firmicutes bacterium]|nr:4-alpha-glucanotransferase [Bacillota bacterium]
MDNKRLSGILLHPTSLWGESGVGDFGKSAYEFIDFLENSGQSLWQILPLVPVGAGNSPYQSSSAFAGEPLMISVQKLKEAELIKNCEPPDFPKERVDFAAVREWKEKFFKEASDTFFEKGETKEYKEFCAKNSFWLDDYALFMALEAHFEGLNWQKWPEALAHREKDAIKEYSEKLSGDIKYHKFLQFQFFMQWDEVKKYAKSKQISIIGDMPIFVSLQSADVWANQKLFLLDEKGYPSHVAGVPPDYFSEKGQLWGNPLYDIKAHADENYEWWKKRVSHAVSLSDIVRMDHFRGFESYWSVPAESPDASIGKWEKGFGAALFKALKQELGALPLIAEDLGIITKEVVKLKTSFKLPGMKVLQFAFSEDSKHPYLPHNCEENSVIYTGTHDNDTTTGWYAQASEKEKDLFRRYARADGSDAAWDMIRLAMGSVSKYCIFPAQDVMALPGSARMNVPGVASGNWEWRIDDPDKLFRHSEGLKYYSELYNRRKEESCEMPAEPAKKTKRAAVRKAAASKTKA